MGAVSASCILASCQAASLIMFSVQPLGASGSRFVHLERISPDQSNSTSKLSLDDMAVFEFQEAIEAWQTQRLLPAIQLFKRSAQKGNEVGEYCYRWGQYHELPPQDIEQALRWYRRGARSLHQGSTTSLGKLHFAIGQPKIASEMLSKTAIPRGLGGESGDSLAQWFLAEMNFQGGAVRNAVRWWKRSAENGDIDAMMRLSHVFSEGASGIPQDWGRSRHWLFAAAAHGHQDALGRISWDVQDRPRVEARWIKDMEQRGWV